MSDWYVIYTTSSGERLAKEDLEDFGYSVFLPVETIRLRPARHRKERKTRIVTRPLFPRYLFVGLPQGWRDFAGVRRSKRVQGFLTDAWGCPVLIAEEVVSGIMADMQRGRYGDAGRRAEQEARRLMRQEAEKAAAASKTMIRPGAEFVMQNGIWKGFLATVAEVRRKDVRVKVQGENGAALFLDVPLLQLEETGVLSSPEGDQQKQCAQLGSSSVGRPGDG